MAAPSARPTGSLHAALLATVFATVACKESRPPAAPRQSPVMRPAVTHAPTLSRFDVPLAYDFTEVLKTVERVVPRTFGSLDEVKTVGDRKQYAFTATRSPFTTFVRGSEVHLRTTLSYSAKGWYKSPLGPSIGASCGTSAPRPRIIAELVAPLTLTRDWHLKSKARLASVVAASDDDRDRCRISFLSIDVTERVLDAARKGIEGRLGDIDAKVAKVDLTKQATKWWAHLNNPIRLADDVWLLLQPQQLRLKGVRGNNHVLNVAAGLDAFPVIVTGPKPIALVTPLPALGSDSGAAGFHVALDGTVDYVTASRALTKALGGKVVNIGSRTVTVRGITASRSTQGRLVLTIGVTGDATGDVRFVGTPRFNRSTDQIVVSDLIFDIATSNPLINTYAWLRSEELLAFFRDKARVPTAPVIAQGSKLIAMGLNRTIGGVLTLNGQVDSLEVLGVQVEPQGLMVRALVTGDARVAVKPKPKKAATATSGSAKQ